MLRTLFCLSFLLVSTANFAQQSAINTHDLVKFDRALDLYNQQQYQAAQSLFREVKNKAEKDEVEADAAYYIAISAVRLGQPNAGELMEAFVDQYPASTKRNSAFIDAANFYFQQGNYRAAQEWYAKTDEFLLSGSEKEEFHFNYGYAFFKNKEFDKAETEFNKVKNSEEYGSQAKYYLGYMAYSGDDYEEATEIFQEVEAEGQTGKNLSYFQADMNFKQGNFEKAIALAKEQLPKSNLREKSQLNKIIGESYFNLENYQEAIPYLKEYRGQRGKWSNTDYYQLGYAYFKQGDYENAISEFNKIINGQNAVAQNAYYHLAQSYLKMGQKQQALNAFKNASEMEFDPRINEGAALNYAKLSYEIGNSYESVPEVLTNFLEKYPYSTAKEEIQALLIDSYISSKNYEAAMGLLEENYRPEARKAYQKVAFLYGIEFYEQGDYQNAIKNFDKSLSVNGSADPAFAAKATYWKAESNYNLNNFQAALNGYQKFKKMSAAKGTGLLENLGYNIGYAQFKLKNYASAIDAFANYTATENENPVQKNDAYLRLGDSYFVTSDYWKAMETYNKAIAMEGINNDYAYFQKAISYGFVGKNDRKIQELNAFLNQFSKSIYRDDAFYELGNTYVAEGNASAGLKAYQNLVNEIPASSFVSKSLLKQGLVYYNNDQPNEALTKFKKVVAEYPNTEESLQAVKTARIIYVDLGRTNEYASWVKNLDFVNVSDADIDNTTYEAAEKQFVENNDNAAAKGFKNYLQQFPNGLNALESHFYLAQIQFKEGKHQESVPHYQYVVSEPRSAYTERALARLSQIQLENKNYAEAIPLLKRLETEADFPQNIVFAQSNLMKAYYNQKDYAQTVLYAEKVLANAEIENNVKSDAQIFIARSAMKTGDENRAEKAYAEVRKIASGALAAEALYYDAYFKRKAGKFEESNAVVQQLAKDYSGYKEFGAKGLVLMAQNFYDLGDAYQATYILDTVIKNFTDFPEVVQEAKTELARIKAIEAETNSSVDVSGQ
ncbi:MAG TPA: tetratricopeptide repeat protein [Flavobacteriaceae bacterium]|nr:tetratricopeptide repeat protein [Flavobacteriaceae bacterium]